MSGAAFVGLNKARGRVQLLADGLKKAASGVVTSEAAAEVAARIDKVQDAFLVRHVRTGDARNEAGAASSGGLVQARRTGYTKFIKGDPFRRGSFPPFILKFAARVYARHLLDALKGERSPAGDEAAAVMAEAAAGDAKRAAKAPRRARK